MVLNPVLVGSMKWQLGLLLLFLALDTFLLSVLINLIYYYYRNEEGKETYQGQQRL